ncbi:hypothetical protein [Janibacter alittae]|uniref:Uncharacterized protein n=1 Tax=Janibacter alittae TaxID=3115209 RepID=A0ABZ2MG25_9MICO
MRTVWFADADSVPAFWETVHEPTGSGVNRAVQAPEKGVKGVRAVELSTFSFPAVDEVEDARATPGMQAAGLVDTLTECGVRLPKRVVDFAYPDEPGEDVTRRARTDLLVIDGGTCYASTWQMWGYQISVTVIDESWLTVLQPARTDVTRLVTIPPEAAQFTDGDVLRPSGAAAGEADLSGGDPDGSTLHSPGPHR